jgi:hypothetical protein
MLPEAWVVELSRTLLSHNAGDDSVALVNKLKYLIVFVK